MTLPIDFETDDPNHPDSHNATNTVVNQVEADLASHDHDADYAPTHAHPYEATGAVASHAGAADPHPGYLNEVDGDSLYEQLGSLAAHAGAPDPHTAYLTAAEGNAAYAPTHAHPYEPTGAVSGHEGAVDAHPGYLTPAEGSAAYAATGHAHAGTYDPAGTAQTHVDDTSAAHAAGSVSYAGSSNLSANNVESALDELDTEKSATTHNHSGTYDPAGTAQTHVDDTTAAHAAASVSYAGSTNLAATTVEGALDELDTEKSGTAHTHAGHTTPHALDDLSDVAVSSPSGGQVLKYNGTAWINDVDATGGGGGTPADTVVAETAFGQASAVGVGADYAREDHTHGSPTNPVTAHASAGDPHTGYRLESAAIVAADIQDAAVTYAKIQDVSATDRLLGRDTAGAGDVEEITPAAARTMLDVPTTGAVTTAVSDHAALADPHTGYRLESADHTHQSTGLQAGQLDHGAALTGLGDDDHGQYLKEKASGGTAAETPEHTHASTAQAGTIAHSATTGQTVNDHHNQAHAVTGADHSHSGGVAGRVLRETGATSFAFQAEPFSVGGVLLDPAGARFVMVWRAPYACTVTNVRGHRKGGTGATVNARRNQTSDFLSSDLSIGTADAWADGGAVQNTVIAAGDDVEIELASITGVVTEIAIQVDLTRP